MKRIVPSVVHQAARRVPARPPPRHGEKREGRASLRIGAPRACACGGHCPRCQVAVEPAAGLPANTPAWTRDATIHLGPAALVAPPALRHRIVAHELAHAAHQQLAHGTSESGLARARAEAVAGRAERNQSLPVADLLSPAPALLAFPPQAYKPFDQVWIGYPGIVGEVVEEGVTVRIFKTYKELGLEKEGKASYVVYECGVHDAAPMPDIAKKMRSVAKRAATYNKAIPKAGANWRTSLVAIHADSSAAGYRTVGGKGLVVAPETEFDTGTLDPTIAHETSHGIFEHHLRAVPGSNGTPPPADPLALRFADLFARAQKTNAVPIPGAGYDPKSPPPLTNGGGMRPAGLVMVMDTLWSGQPNSGHPWDGVDEFFASAHGGFLREPKLLKKIAKYYEKADPQVKSLAAELFTLLKAVGQPKAITALKPPKDRTEADQVISGVGEPPDFTTSKQGTQLGWLIDPTDMPSPDKIYCAKSTPETTHSIDELLEGIDDLPDEEKKPRP